jgi:outer membrane lipoprotein LolB
MLGWTLPVSGLPDWIEGRPVAGRPAVLSPPQGLIETIEQDGWTIRILERFDASPDPRRIELARAQSTTSPSVVLRIVLDARSAKGQP